MNRKIVLRVALTACLANAAAQAMAQQAAPNAALEAASGAQTNILASPPSAGRALAASAIRVAAQERDLIAQPDAADPSAQQRLPLQLLWLRPNPIR